MGISIRQGPQPVKLLLAGRVPERELDELAGVGEADGRDAGSEPTGDWEGGRASEPVDRRAGGQASRRASRRTDRQVGGPTTTTTMMSEGGRMGMKVVQISPVGEGRGEPSQVSSGSCDIKNGRTPFGRRGAKRVEGNRKGRRVRESVCFLCASQRRDVCWSEGGRESCSWGCCDGSPGRAGRPEGGRLGRDRDDEKRGEAGGRGER